MSLTASYTSATDTRPSLTRESTACGTESTLPTPLDEPSLGPRLKPRGPNLAGKSREQCLQLDTARVYTPSQDNDKCISGVVDATPRAMAGPDSYFALSSRPLPTLSRGNTTKDLINRFESISSSPQTLPRNVVAPAGSIIKRVAPLPELPRPFSELRSKSRNKLRESFRSIISIFGKKGKGNQSGGPLLGIRYEESSQGHPSPVILSTPQLLGPPSASSKSSVIRAGPLLYLSRPTSGGVLPVWTNCNASLSSDQIRLEWNTSYGNPCSRVIMLRGSNNVRSLSKPEVNSTERSLLPDTSRDAYVLEVTYDKSEPERFAMNSVAERSAWVSAIWDTLLQRGSSSENNEFNRTGGSRELCDEMKGLDTQIQPEVSETEIKRHNNPSTASSMSIRRGPLPIPPVEADEIVIPLSRRHSILQPDLGSVPSVTSSLSASAKASLGPQLRSLEASVQDLDGLSTVQRRLSQFSGGRKSSFDLSRKHTQISAASRYSDVYEDQSAPPARRPHVFRTNALTDLLTLHNINPHRESEITRGDNDNQSIFDFYAEKNTPYHPLALDLGASRSITAETPVVASECHKDTGYVTVGPGEDLKPAASAPSSDGIHVKSPSLLALIQDHAVQQFSQTSDLTSHVVSLKNNITTMSTDLRIVLSEQVPGSEVRRALEGLCAKIEDIGKQLNKSCVSNAPISGDGNGDIPPQLPNVDIREENELPGIVESLNRVEERIGEDLPAIFGLLNSLQTSGTDEGVRTVQTKIEELIQLVKAKEEKPMKYSLSDIPIHAGETKVAEEKLAQEQPDNLVLGPHEGGAANKLEEVLSLLRNDVEHKKTISEQQGENVRYLQELNRWLESFVENGTSQIKGVVHGIQRLCEELGCPLEGQESEDTSDANPPSLKAQLTAVIALMQVNEDKTTGLQSSMLEALEASKNSDAQRSSIDMESVANMIERQRQEQEATLRAIASDLSNDIRGERLRFVEAMKEATAINVQVHVEEFKKELSREVMMMTCEVGRLQRERQMLEQQIADLFAFFSKQRAEMEMIQRGRAQQNAQPPPTQHGSSNNHVRPLPVPGH